MKNCGKLCEKQHLLKKHQQIIIICTYIYFHHSSFRVLLKKYINVVENQFNTFSSYIKIKVKHFSL